MESETQKKIIKGRAEILSHENCDVCPDTISFLGNKENFEIPIEYNEIKHTSEAGQKWITEKKLADAEGNIKTPAIKKCDIYEDGTEDCKEITGFNESDYTNWKKKLNNQASEPSDETIGEKTESSPTG